MKKSHNLRGIFLDFDGTLVDSIQVMSKSYEIFLSKFAIKTSKNEFEQLNGPTLNTVVKQLKINHNLNKSFFELLGSYNEIIDSLYEEVLPNEGAFDLIQSACERSLLLAIVTSNSELRIKKWLNKFQLIDSFNFVISGDNVALGKPCPEPYLLALKQANMNRNEVVAIEDSIQGAKSALDANITTYLIANNLPIINRTILNYTPIESLAQFNKDYLSD